MKSHLRRAISWLGLYGTAGVLAARAQGLTRGIRIETRADVYRVRDRAGRVIVLGRRHAIYLSDMVAFFDFFFGAVVPDSNGEVHYEMPAWPPSARSSACGKLLRRPRPKLPTIC